MASPHAGTCCQLVHIVLESTTGLSGCLNFRILSGERWYKGCGKMHSEGSFRDVKDSGGSSVPLSLVAQVQSSNHRQSSDS